MKDKIYKSKFGWAVFSFIAAIFFVTLWLSYQPEKNIYGSILAIIIPMVVLALYAIMSLAIRYTITATDMHIKFLPFYNKSIALDRIRKVEVTRNIMSSPAPSLDRIEIYFDKFDSVVISPKNKLQFMDDLKALNPSIELIKTY